MGTMRALTGLMLTLTCGVALAADPPPETTTEILAIEVHGDPAQESEHQYFLPWFPTSRIPVPISVGFEVDRFDPPRKVREHEAFPTDTALMEHLLWIVGENKREAYRDLMGPPFGPFGWETSWHNLRNRLFLVKATGAADLRIYRRYATDGETLFEWGSVNSAERMLESIYPTEDGYTIRMTRYMHPMTAIVYAGLAREEEPLDAHLGNTVLELAEVRGTPKISLGFTGEVLPRDTVLARKGGAQAPTQQLGSNASFGEQAVAAFRDSLNVLHSIPRSTSFWKGHEIQALLERLTRFSAALAAQSFNPDAKEQQQSTKEDILARLVADQKHYENVTAVYRIDADPMHFIFWTSADLNAPATTTVRELKAEIFIRTPHGFRWSKEYEHWYSRKRHLPLPIKLFESWPFQVNLIELVDPALGLPGASGEEGEDAAAGDTDGR